MDEHTEWKEFVFSADSNRKDVIVQNELADTYSLSECSFQTLSVAWATVPRTVATEELD